MKIAALVLLAAGAALWLLRRALPWESTGCVDEWTFPVDPWPPMDHAPTCPAGGTGGWKYTCQCGFAA